MFGALLEVCCSKSDRDCGAKWISKSKCQNTTSSDFFYTFNRPTVIFHGNRNGCCKKWAKREGFVAVSKTLAGVDLQRCILLGRGNTRDASVRHVRKSGRWFPWKGCILECRIFRFAKIILRDRHKTSHDLVSLFQGHAQYFGEMGWKNHKMHWFGPISLARAHQLCTPRPIFIRSLAELFGFDFLRKSREILSFGAVNFYPHTIASRQVGTQKET